MIDVICFFGKRRHDYTKTKGSRVRDFTGWLQRWPESEPRSSSWRWRHKPDGMVFPTRTFQRMHNRDSRSTAGLVNVPDRLFAEEDGDAGIDNDFAARGFENIGAWIMGRNMFGPIRGAWADDNWKGWWGDNPPFHCDVFVLTHHFRAPLTMEGGTTFRFVTDGIQPAVKQARAAANGKDVRVGGGSQPFEHSCKHVCWTNCTSHSRQSCSASENLCSPGLICHRSATIVSSAFLQPRPLTLCWHGPKLHYAAWRLSLASSWSR